MFNMRTAAILTLLLLFTTGCMTVTASTSKPLFDPTTDARFDPRMVGVWLPEYLCLNLQKGEGNSYVAGSSNPGSFVAIAMGIYAQGDEGHPAEPAKAYLVPIGKYRYFFPNVKPGEGTSLSSCCRVTVGTRCMTFESLNIAAIIDDLREHPDALKFRWRPKLESVPASQPASQPLDLHHGAIRPFAHVAPVSGRFGDHRRAADYSRLSPEASGRQGNVRGALRAAQDIAAVND